MWSSRRAAIEHRVGQLAKEFQTEHGREPTVVEMLALSQQATLQTRQAKHEPRSLAEQRHTWRTQAVEILGSQRELGTMVAGHHRQCRPGGSAPPITGDWVQRAGRRRHRHRRPQTRSTWQSTTFAPKRPGAALPRHPGGPELANRIVTAALGEHSIALTDPRRHRDGEPAALRRRDGASVYTRHDTTVYTSAAVMAAERRILAAAGDAAAASSTTPASVWRC